MKVEIGTEAPIFLFWEYLESWRLDVRNSSKCKTVIVATPGRGVQFFQTEKGIVVYFLKRKDCFLEQT